MEGGDLADPTAFRELPLPRTYVVYLHLCRFGRLLIHQQMAGLLRHAVEPGADRRKRGQIEIARVREMGMGVERDVRDGVAVGREIVVVLEVIVHDTQRVVPRFHPAIQRVLL